MARDPMHNMPGAACSSCSSSLQDRWRNLPVVRSKMCAAFLALAIISCCTRIPCASSFLVEKNSLLLTRPSGQTRRIFLSSTRNNWEDNLRELRSIQERQTENALIDALFFGDDVVPSLSSDKESSSSASLLSIQLSGQARLPVITNQTKQSSTSGQKRIALVLTRQQAGQVDDSSALLLPLASRAQLKLVSFAAAGRALSKSVLLGLNTLLVNRDGALFDNLPWSEWSIDPQMRNRDAAGNPIDSKFHLGKRDAYNRFMGKDWQGRSLALGNMALRLKYMLETDEDETMKQNSDDDKLSPFDQEETGKALATRVLQLQIRELQMELADIESQLAIARVNGGKEARILEKEQMQLLETIASTKEDLATVVEGTKRSTTTTANVMERIADWTTDNGNNAAPYRGAMGYAPALDSKKDINDSRLPYSSPYDLLKEILQDQLNAKVIGCVLENTSLLKGNLALGGAIALQRITPTKTVEMGGEVIEYNDYDEEFGNMGVGAGSTILVECDSDEAIGVALAFSVPLKVESKIFGQSAVPVEQQPSEEEKSDNIIEYLTLWKTVDPEMNFQVEGERQLSQRSNPISIPRTTTSLFDGISEEKPASSPLFPADNPIKSLSEYDALSNEEKAKTLLELSNFSGRLPRPRVLRQRSSPNPLDEMLLPLIDESVRRQYYIRDAEVRGDIERAAQLRAEKSKRQAALERAQEAREAGNPAAFERWETEAEFLESLRADVTQNEGSYSRFLDRDEWYEKDRQATAKRVDRSKFGNLLDGIE